MTSAAKHVTYAQTRCTEVDSVPANTETNWPADRFLLSEMRVIQTTPRSVLITHPSGPNVTFTLEDPPLPGTCVQINLGNLGWVEGTVRWTAGTECGVELNRNIDWAAFDDEHRVNVLASRC